MGRICAEGGQVLARSGCRTLAALQQTAHPPRSDHRAIGPGGGRELAQRTCMTPVARQPKSRAPLQLRGARVGGRETSARSAGKAPTAYPPDSPAATAGCSGGRTRDARAVHPQRTHPPNGPAPLTAGQSGGWAGDIRAKRGHDSRDSRDVPDEHPPGLRGARPVGGRHPLGGRAGTGAARQPKSHAPCNRGVLGWVGGAGMAGAARRPESHAPPCASAGESRPR